MARRFGEPHVARNDRLKHLLLEKLAHVRRHLRSQIRPLVIHRQEHAIDVERRIQSRAHTPQRRHEIGESFEREIFAVQRDEHGFGGDERVQRQQAERRRAVDEDVIEAIAERREKSAQLRFAPRQRHHFDLGARQIAIGGQDRQIGNRGRAG